MNNEIFYDICRKGNYDIVYNRIQENITSEFFMNWTLNNGLNGACAGGHINIIELLLNKGARFYEWGLSGATDSYNVPIIKMMIELGATELENTITKTITKNDTELFDYLVKCIKKPIDLTDAFYNVCSNDNILLFEKLCDIRNENKCAIYYSDMLKLACINNSTKIIDHITKTQAAIIISHTRFLKLITNEQFESIKILITNHTTDYYTKVIKYPEHTDLIRGLLVNGIELCKLNKIKNYDLLIKKIDTYQNKYRNIINEFLVNNVTNLIIEYIVVI